MTAPAPFVIHGNAAQVTVATNGLTRCSYPWDVLALVHPSPIHVYWDTSLLPSPGPGIPSGVLGTANSGLSRIVLNESLTNRATLAAEVMLSEGSHLVDGYTFTEADRDAIAALYHTYHLDNHSWLRGPRWNDDVGEAAMVAFIRAFSNVPITINPFSHRTTSSIVAGYKRIALARAAAIRESVMPKAIAAPDFPIQSTMALDLPAGTVIYRDGITKLTSLSSAGALTYVGMVDGMRAVVLSSAAFDSDTEQERGIAFVKAGTPRPKTPAELANVGVALGVPTTSGGITQAEVDASVAKVRAEEQAKTASARNAGYNEGIDAAKVALLAVTPRAV